MAWRLLIILALTIAASPFPAVAAQQSETPTAAIIALEPGEGSDALIAQRIAGIFAQIRQFESLEVSVSSGVVAVSGQVANEAQAQRALQMASRIDGAIAVDDPAQAIQTGLTALQQLDWILNDPEPHGIIDSVGDSNILIKFMACVSTRLRRLC